jgi:hypothetical protein
MEELPRVGAMGAQPYADILGMGDPADRSMPAIVCLQCSTRWPNADAFWAAANATAEPAEADAEAAARDGAGAGDGAASDSAASDARPELS